MQSTIMAQTAAAAKLVSVGKGLTESRCAALLPSLSPSSPTQTFCSSSFAQTCSGLLVGNHLTICTAANTELPCCCPLNATRQQCQCLNTANTTKQQRLADLGYERLHVRRAQLDHLAHHLLYLAICAQQWAAPWPTFVVNTKAHAHLSR